MGNITRKELGERIREARLAKNCSIEKLSWLTGYTKDWLSWLENGDPYEKMLSETGKALGVDLTADTPDDWKKEIEHEIEIAKKDRREIETRNERDRECFKHWQEEANKKQDELKKRVGWLGDQVKALGNAVPCETAEDVKETAKDIL